MLVHPSAVRDTAAGVPFLAVPPESRPSDATPIVLAWHLMDAPCTEAAFAAALPLAGLDAWRIYLGLPMYGSRQPAGGVDEIMRLAYEDAVLNLQGPVARQAFEELPAALDALRLQLGLGHGPVGVVGGSLGAAVAELVLTGSGPAAGFTAAAAVLLSPVSQLRPAVDATGRRYGVDYPWGPEALAVARELDFVERAGEIAANGQPAVRLVVGAEDDEDGFLVPAQRLCAALAERYDDPARADLVVVDGMGHALAEEPGVEPAPQTSYAAVADAHAVAWLRRHLGAD